jgi:sugar lactone lactonase YvrE
MQATMALWVGRYALVGGVVREHGPWFVERVRIRDDEQVRLLVLAEPVDEQSADFASEVAEAVAELFARESLSVTGGLLRALRQAHGNLAEWNRRSLREHRVAVGITAVAIRDNEVTLAQAGPGLAYLYGPDGAQRLAAESDGEAANPIGGAAPVEPQFFSTGLDDRLLLLLTSNVERILGETPILNALAAGADRALAELFLRTRDIQNMTAVLAADVDLPADVIASPAGSPPDEGAGEPRRRPWLEQAPVPSPAPPLDSGSQLLRGPRRMNLPLRRERGPYASTTGAPGALARVGVRRAPQEGALQRHWRGFAAGVIALLVIALVSWCALPGFVQEDRGAQLEDALSAAQQHLTAATQASDLATSRRELDSARAELVQARTLQPGEPRVDELQGQADQFARSLDAIVDLGDGLRRVVAFEGAVTAPFNAASLVFGDGALWLLDSQRGRVFRIDPAVREEPQEVYRAGATYGGTTARDPRALAWDGKEQRVLLLDAGPNLFALVAGRPPAPIALRNAGDIRSIAAIATYDGNLYALDPQGGEIWRYLPGGTGYDSERSAILGGVQLAEARALAVDGDLFVLHGSGLRHFRPPGEEPAMLQGIDRQPSSAAGLAVDPQRQLLYVGDRGSRRVVVSDREGTYRRQYRAPQFIDVRSLCISADGSTVYVLTGDGIYAFTPTP